MNDTIDINLPIIEILRQNPEIIDLLVPLGFEPLTNPAMLNTVGKITSLKRGAKLAGISLEKIVSSLELNGYRVMEAEE